MPDQIFLKYKNIGANQIKSLVSIFVPFEKAYFILHNEDDQYIDEWELLSYDVSEGELEILP